MFQISSNLLLDRAEAQETIANFFPVPSYYGKNLDAMYDYFTSLGKDCYLTIIEKETSADYQAVRHVLEEAAQTNPNFHLTIR
ncbi:hypothetical protein AWM75_03815 [Aerococcus urinaehominis]|uniref:Barstar (barnase inhibitor) domain-containing protein n=1 Tax=Aerococcus urinaehominis TaxID=128944 RepID=A0A0X8FKW6_9LACT|nr:barstar family protein [Aerococcus urinaehominis]AMB99185.1 hypothetical protein AWM75_03815 [Aerococcus urinaehominis]SDM06719.1 Barstar (barnase inhibitor) [Aerococcus urinaehominis]